MCSVFPCELPNCPEYADKKDIGYLQIKPEWKNREKIMASVYTASFQYQESLENEFTTQANQE